jgi:DNA-binding ferritin-like protein
MSERSSKIDQQSMSAASRMKKNKKIKKKAEESDSEDIRSDISENEEDE